MISAAKVAQLASDSTVLWSPQRQCAIVNSPMRIASVSTTKPASTNRNVSRSSDSNGMPSRPAPAFWRIWRSAASSIAACTTATPNSA